MKGIRLVGFMLVMLLVLGSGIAFAEQEEGDAQEAGASPTESASLPERTANSETVSLPDGQLETRIYPDQINYRDKEGNWQPIGEKLRETSDQTLTNGPNSFDVTLPRQIDSKPVRFEVGDQWVESQLLRKDLEDAELDGTLATYEGEGNAPSFEFTGLSNGLKEEIELSNPGQTNRFAYELSASDGLTPSLAEDGSVRFLDSEGTAVVVLPAPVMSDKSGAESRDVHYELGSEEDGHWTLSVIADREWLEQPERVFPAVIDPTMTVGPALDCIIGGEKGKTGWIDCAAWGRQNLLIDYTPKLEASKDAWQRGLLHLETEAIPTAAIVSSATFNIRSNKTAVNTTGVELRRTTQPWNWEASWSRYDGTHLWTTEGGDYSESLGEVLTATRGTQIGWWQFNIPPKAIQEEAAKEENLGVLMKLLDDKSRVCGPTSCTQREVWFDSSTATTVANRPYLSVIYTLPAPIVTTEAPTSVTETGATLKGQVNPNGYATTYQFEYGLTTSYGTKVPASPESVGSGKTNVAISKAISGLKANTTYHYRVSAINANGTTVGTDQIFTTPKLPTATTEAATAISEAGAMLKGSVTTYEKYGYFSFEYGLTAAYGSEAPASPQLIFGGGTATPVSEAVKGLKQGTTYHYRLRGSNFAGYAYGADKTFTTTNPPQTTIISPTPTYLSTEAPAPVKFEASQAGSTFKCGFDEGEKPTKICTSPYILPGHPTPGWHTFVVSATNAKGEADQTPAKYVFNPGVYPAAPSTSKLTAPTEGEQAASYFTLQAEWGSAPTGGGVTSVTFQYIHPGWSKPVFENVPAQCVIDKEGKEVSWPLPVSQNPGHTDPVFFNVVGCPASAFGPHANDPIKFRAVFDGGTKAAGASEPVSAEALYPKDGDPGASTDATQQIGPVNLDLLSGTYTYSHTDVSIPVPGSESNLEFTRTYASHARAGSVLGQWSPSAPVERAFEGEAWTELREHHEPGTSAQYDKECEMEGWSHEECMIEEALPASDWIEVEDNEGGIAAFEIQGGNYIAPEYMKEYVLTKQGSGTGTTFELASPEGTHTVFVMNSVGGLTANTYRAASVSWQATAKSARMVYEHTEGSGQFHLSKMIAPAPSGVECKDATSTETPGCRTLTFQYGIECNCAAHLRLTSITYYNSSGQPSQAKEVARYEYTSGESPQLIAEWDPRAPTLKETYTYNHWAYLETITPPGLAPWEFEYYRRNPYSYEGLLKSVKRASLIESQPTAETTIVYEVPISGSGAPYDMSAASIAKWGQSDAPVNATAVFPPSEVPSEPPSSYSEATITYMDPDGYAVNVASPQVPGASGPSIGTSETDRHGNVVRSLSAQNRLAALAAGGESVSRSQKLDEQSTYSTDGTKMLESLGPLHKVRLEASGTAEARAHTVIQYDQNAPEVPKGSAPYALPTTATTSARLSSGEDVESRVTETRYNWKLRKPEETITDPGKEHLELKTRIAYDESTGLPTERSLPAKPTGGDAHTTKTIYYTKEANPQDSSCGGNAAYAELPCKTLPASQPGTAGLPELLVTRYAKYNGLGEPEEVIESPGGKEEAGKTRKTIKTYDTAGRAVTSRQVGGGTELPPTETIYNGTTGAPVETKLTCETKCEGFDDQAVMVAYDELGRPVQYTDADGNTSKAKYDLLGRPESVFDGKGTQTFGYEENSGLLVAMNDSAAGTFTASYDADGKMLEEGLPNGLVAKTTYNEAGEATKLSYTKVVSCSEKCTWIEESNERSIRGQILSQTSLSSSQQYSYDNAGRLTLTQDTTGGSCTTRQYFFENEAGKDSNRTKMTTRAPGIGGACDTKSTGTSQEYKYDAADRLIGPEAIAYDPFGRITKLPGKWAGGSTLETTFFSNNMVASQSQAGLTNTYQLDAAGRPRQVTQTGTKTGTETFHYSMASDSTAWTERSGAWTRSISGIGRGLAAIQESSGTTSLQLTNLHGDVVATASLSLSAKEPTGNFEFDEFGNPKKGSAGRYGWLGGKQRRTELPSGVIQMGVRSYVPTIGRFISVDPVLGGSANAYDYANADPINGLDLSGEVSGCGIQVKVISRKHRVYASAKYRCPKSAWPFPVSREKTTVKFERHSKGAIDEFIHGPFETKGAWQWTPRNPSDPKWRNWEEIENFRCGDLGREYRITYEVTVTYQSPTGWLPGRTELIKGSDTAICRR